MTNDADRDRYRTAARILHDVAKPMRVLSALAWPGELRVLQAAIDRSASESSPLLPKACPRTNAPQARPETAAEGEASL